MAVDTRLKRQSATCILLPSLLIGVFPSTSGVVQAERQAVSWSYSGILAAGAVIVAGAWLRRMRLWLIILTEEENGTFCY